MNTSQSIFPMNDQHRATDSEWYCLEARTCGDKADVVAYSCILELRDRIKALEATHHAHVDLSHLSDAERERMLKSIADPGRFEALEAAAQPNHPAKPDSSLVDRVACAIYPDGSGDGFRVEARAAIYEVAAWMGEQKPYGAGLWSLRLEQEAER